MLSLLLPLWFFLALIVPIVFAWFNGSTYTFAFSISLLGIVLCFISIFKERQIKIRWIRKSKAEFGLKNSSEQSSLGIGFKNSSKQIPLPKGITPYWVPILMFFGLGLIASGLIIALLLWLAIIINKAH